jgi:amidase
MSQHVSAVSLDDPSSDTALAVDPFFALVPNFVTCRTERDEGTLSGLRFVAKDLFDIRGEPTGSGSPELRSMALPAAQDAMAVTQLLQGGATLIGRAKCDAFAYGLAGTSSRDGIPINPQHPDRVPGGSSSGSAVAVASGIADLGLASDTGGSIRIPAAYCGLFGWRPTHGLVGTDGMHELAKDFDTVGLLASNPTVLIAGAGVLAPNFDSADSSLVDVCVIKETLKFCDSVIRSAVLNAQIEICELLDLEATEQVVELDLEDARVAFQNLQSAQAWKAHGMWIEKNPGLLPPEVEARFRRGETVTTVEIDAARTFKERVVLSFIENFQRHSVFIIPAAPTAPPALRSTSEQLNDIRMRTLAVTSLAGLAGLPCVVVPVDKLGRPCLMTEGSVEKAAAGVCLVGRRETDHALLSLVSAWVGRSQAKGIPS